MNIAKNMELIFIAALALAGATSIATASAPQRASAPAVVAAADAGMQVVTVTAKRMTAAEKARIAL